MPIRINCQNRQATPAQALELGTVSRKSTIALEGSLCRQSDPCWEGYLDPDNLWLCITYRGCRLFASVIQQARTAGAIRRLGVNLDGGLPASRNVEGWI